MWGFVWYTVLHYTHIQNCNKSKAWNSLLLKIFIAGCRCSPLLLSQHIRLDQWPELAGVCWKESITRVCHTALVRREAERWDRSNQKIYTINHQQNLAMCSFHNIFPPLLPSITTDFFFFFFFIEQNNDKENVLLESMPFLLYCCSWNLFLHS